MTGSKLEISAGLNPFVGPRPIETGQRIFGRDREIEELYYLLSAERILLLHSPSGAGKSSLIQAGLVPRLGERFDVWGPARTHLPPPVNSPAGANRYVRSVNLSFEAQIPESRQRSRETVSRMTLAGYVAGRPRRRSAPANVVLLFDQFEEVLTADPLAFDARREFFQQLGALLLDPKVWALFALREDYLAQFDPYADLLPTHFRNRFRLDLLSRDAAREALTQTAAEGGRDAAPEAVDKLVRDLATMQVQQPDGSFQSQTGRYVEPLHLQVACRGLWERIPPEKRMIDLDDIASFGDVTQALAGYYEREVSGIAGGDEAAERAIREWVGEKLITAEGIRGQVLKGAGKSEGLGNPVIARLVDSHLVRGESRAGAVWYELAHDRLIEPVRRNNAAWREAHLNQVQKVAAVWEAQGRPAGLLVTGPELAEAQAWARRQAGITPAEQRFLAASEEAHAAAEKERRQARRLRWALVASTVGLALALVAGGIAWWKSGQAQLATAAAQESLKQSQIDKANAAASARQVRWTAWKSEGTQLRAISEQQRRIEEAQRETLRATAVRIVSESEVSPGLTRAEYTNLWQLAGAGEDLRELVLLQYLATAPNARKFNARRTNLVRAFLGFDPLRRMTPVRRAVEQSCTAAAMEAAPDIRYACLSLVNELSSTPSELYGRFLPLIGQMKAEEVGWLGAALGTADDKRLAGHLIAQSMEWFVKDLQVQKDPKFRITVPDWELRGLRQKCLVDNMDGLGSAAAAADVAVAGHWISRVLSDTAEIGARTFDAEAETIRKASVPLAGFLARRQASISDDDLKVAGKSIVALMKSIGLPVYDRNFLGLPSFPPLSNSIVALHDRIAPADFIAAGRAVVAGLIVAANSQMLRLVDSGPVIPQLVKCISDYRPPLGQKEVDDALQPTIAAARAGTTDIQFFAGKEPYEVEMVGRFRTLNESLLGPQTEEMRSLASRYLAAFEAYRLEEPVHVNTLLAMGPDLTRQIAPRIADVVISRMESPLIAVRVLALKGIPVLKHVDQKYQRRAAELIVETVQTPRCTMSPYSEQGTDPDEPHPSNPRRKCVSAGDIKELVGALGQLDVVTPAQWSTTAEIVLNRLNDEEEVPAVLILMDGLGTRIDPVVVRNAEPRILPLMKAAFQAVQMAGAILQLSDRFELKRIAEAAYGLLAKRDPAAVHQDISYRSVTRLKNLSAPTMAALGEFTWAWLELPDEQLAGRLRGIFHGKLEPERQAALCEAAGVLIHKRRPRMSQVFAEEVLKWPVCSAEQHSNVINALKDAGEIAPQDGAAALDQLPRWRLAERLTEKRFDMARAPIPAGGPR